VAQSRRLSPRRLPSASQYSVAAGTMDVVVQKCRPDGVWCGTSEPNQRRGRKDLTLSRILTKYEFSDHVRTQTLDFSGLRLLSRLLSTKWKANPTVSPHYYDFCSCTRSGCQNVTTFVWLGEKTLSITRLREKTMSRAHSTEEHN
jgi:hypothetical protein